MEPAASAVRIASMVEPRARRHNPGMAARLVYLVPGFFGFTPEGFDATWDAVAAAIAKGGGPSRAVWAGRASEHAPRRATGPWGPWEAQIRRKIACARTPAMRCAHLVERGPFHPPPTENQAFAEVLPRSI